MPLSSCWQGHAYPINIFISKARNIDPLDPSNRQLIWSGPRLHAIAKYDSHVTNYTDLGEHRQSPRSVGRSTFQAAYVLSSLYSSVFLLVGCPYR